MCEGTYLVTVQLQCNGVLFKAQDKFNCTGHTWPQYLCHSHICITVSDYHAESLL